MSIIVYILIDNSFSKNQLRNYLCREVHYEKVSLVSAYLPQHLISFSKFYVLPASRRGRKRQRQTGQKITILVKRPGSYFTDYLI